MEINLLKLRVSNAYLIRGERPIIVDTGSPNDTETIRSQLRALNVEFADLALIIHTHVHSDHMGSTAEIAAEAKCPVAYHRADQGLVERSHNDRLYGVGLRGKIMSQFFSNAKFNSVNADIELYDGMSLTDFGWDATVVATPGHTAGSISIVTAQGDAIIGDLIMGGYMGGRVWPTRPNHHYFAENIAESMSSLDVILSQTKRTLYVGHGGPLSATAVTQWRQRQNQ